MDISIISDLTQNMKKRAQSGYAWLVFLLGAVLVVGLWLFVSHQIEYDYDRSVAETSLETMNLAKAFEEYVLRVVGDADIDLINIKKTYEQEGLSSPILRSFFETAAREQSQNFAIYDENGIIVSSFLKSAIGYDRSDAEYFLQHREALGEDLVIGKTFLGPITKKATIPLTRRINKPDGSFGGVVFIGLRTDYFHDFYNKIDIGQDRLIALVGTDGFNRARRVGDNLETGQNNNGTNFWRTVQSSGPFATFLSTNILDGVTRISSFRTLREYPLIVVVGKSTQVALAGYEQRKKNYIFAASIISLFILFICGLIIRLVSAVQKEKDRLFSLINSISDEVWFADPDKIFSLANPAALRAFGIEAASSSVEAIVSSVEVLRDDGSLRPAEESPPLRALRGEAVRNHLEIVRIPATGELRYRELNANPVRDARGNIIGSVSVVRDITERKHAEEKNLKLSSELAENYCRLLELNATLETEIIERLAAQEELGKVNQSLEAASQSKSRFLANMSHELRTPLNAIIGFSQVLMKEMFGTLNSKQEEYVKHIQESGQHLLGLVNDLLDLSKTEAGKIDLEKSWINMQEICTDSLNPFHEKAASRQVRLSISIEDSAQETLLFADKRKIKQILYNLIENGIKFNKPNGFVAITVKKITADDQPSAIQIVVEDSGIGITSENLVLLFNPFIQLSRNHTEPADGAGLGLALTKRLVELHGGEIRVESEPDKGSRFIVWIPMTGELA